MQETIQAEDMVTMMDNTDDTVVPTTTPLLVNMFLEIGMGSAPLLGIAEGETEEDASCAATGENVGIMLDIGTAVVATSTVDKGGDDDDDSCSVVVGIVAGGDVIELIGVVPEEGDATAAPEVEVTVDAVIVSSTFIMDGAFVQSPATIPDVDGAIAATPPSPLFIVLVP